MIVSMKYNNYYTNIFLCNFAFIPDGAEVEVDLEKLKTTSTLSKEAPNTLRPCATDAYLLFQVSIHHSVLLHFC